MKANELRIGNYLIDRENRLCKVEVLNVYKDETNIYAPAISGPLTAMPIKPIKLTTEWLERFGFVKDGEKYRNEHYMFLQRWYIKEKIKRNSKLYSLIIHKDYVRHIEYVHQLQNLYFALTGEELTLKE